MVKDLPNEESVWDRETFVSIAASADGNRARARRARDASLYEQIARLLAAGTPPNLREITPRLKLDTVELDENTCPALSGAVGELIRDEWRFDFTPDPEDAQGRPMHPCVFIIASSGLFGSEFQLECRSPTPQCDRLARAYEAIVACMPGTPPLE